MNNNDWMLATALRGNTVANELYETNSKIILLVKTLAGYAQLFSFTKNHISLNAFFNQSKIHI